MNSPAMTRIRVLSIALLTAMSATPVFAQTQEQLDAQRAADQANENAVAADADAQAATNAAATASAASNAAPTSAAAAVAADVAQQNAVQANTAADITAGAAATANKAFAQGGAGEMQTKRSAEVAENAAATTDVASGDAADASARAQAAAQAGQAAAIAAPPPAPAPTPAPTVSATTSASADATGTATFTTAQGDPVTITSRHPTPPPDDHRAEFAAMDRDGNGNITRREAGRDKYLLRAWGQLDADASGRLDFQEMLVWLDD